MYYLLLTDEGLDRVDDFPFDVPDDLPRVIASDPTEVFRMVSPASGQLLVGLAARDAGRQPISAFLVGALAAHGHRVVSGPLAVFGLEADGRTYRDLTNAEMDDFRLTVDSSGTTALHLGDATA